MPTARFRTMDFCIRMAVCLALPGLLASHERVGAQSQIVVKIGTVAPEGSPWADQLHRFGRHLTKQSEGRIRAKVLLGGSLGDEAKLVRRTLEGSLQVFAGSVEALSSTVPALGVLHAPFVFRNPQHAGRSLDGPAKRLVQSALLDAGLVFAMWSEWGFRSWYTRERTLRKPEDLKGLRLYAGPDQGRADYCRVLGAGLAPVSVGDVSKALREGNLDGFEATPIAAVASSWYRWVGHLTLSRHSYQPGIVVYSKHWFDGLPEQMQHALARVPHGFAAETRKSVRAVADALFEILRDRGVAIHELTRRERTAFAAATRQVPRTLAGRAGPTGWKMLRAIRRTR